MSLSLSPITASESAQPRVVTVAIFIFSPETCLCTQELEIRLLRPRGTLNRAYSLVTRLKMCKINMSTGFSHIIDFGFKTSLS